MTFRMRSNGYRGGNGNLRNMIFLSLIIHFIVITAILISVPTTSRHLTFGTVYSVQLVGSDAILPANDSSSGLKDMLQQNEAERSIIIKRKITSIYSTPVKNQETHKLNIEKAVSAIRKKELAQSKTPDSVSAGRQTVSNAEIDAQTNDYIAVVWSRVKQNWTMPQTLMPEKNITTIIDVRISRSGALGYTGFEKRSGNSYFDESALRAVKKSSPFPPLPQWVMENSIEIGIRFNSTELR